MSILSKRYISAQILKDLNKKMVLLAGPRQVGKTTLSKDILSETKGVYLNWDFDEDRALILEGKLPRNESLIVLDEIHKYPKWRNLIKGYFDKFSPQLKILVTGSGRLDYYSHGGDSLQGRYHLHHLFPLSVAELQLTEQEDLGKLLQLSGFPEPYYAQSEVERSRWCREYRRRLVREDLRDLERVQDLTKIELLCNALPEKVGSPLSINSLAEDLDVSHQSVTKWLSILERLYYFVRLPPFGAKKLRAVKKEMKLYLFDWALVDDEGCRFENMVALHLLKWIYFQNDCLGKNLELRYFRDIDRREVDFVILEEKAPIMFVECKLKDKEISSGLKYLKTRFPRSRAIQVILESGIDYRSAKHDIEVVSALMFLRELV